MDAAAGAVPGFGSSLVVGCRAVGLEVRLVAVVGGKDCQIGCRIDKPPV